MKKAFTMIELIFVIILIGILASFAIPKFGSITEDTYVTKYKAQIASIRSGILRKKQDSLLQGNLTAPNLNSGVGLFGNVLLEPLKQDKDRGWKRVGDGKPGSTSYTLSVADKKVVFVYDENGTFDCDAKASSLCEELNN